MKIPLDPRLPNTTEKIARIRQIAGDEDQFEELSDLLLLGNSAIVSVAESEDGPLPIMTPPQRVLSTLKCFNTQVLNGGIFQFFCNCPRWAIHVEPALRAIDFPELADAFVKAIAQLIDETDSVASQKNLDALDWNRDATEGHNLEWFNDLYFANWLEIFYTKSVAYIYSNLSGFAR